VVEVCPNPPNPVEAVVVAPKPAGLLPKSPVLPAVEVAPKADVAAVLQSKIKSISTFLFQFSVHV